MIYVIGSGPAGVSSSVALVRKGHDVTMLDAGIELEAERRQMLEELTVQKATDWDAVTLERLKDNMRPTAEGVSLKYSYGSDFPYRETEAYVPRELRNAAIFSSLAQGGLSNVWGAAILPYAADDMSDWPLTLEELGPHYRSVLSFMGLAAVRDDLESQFPLYSDNYAAMRTCEQIKDFLGDLGNNRKQLQADGFLFGSSRLAVYSRNRNNHECATCGLCLYGCPYGLIYNSAQTLEELRQHSNFTYVKDVIVQKLEESVDYVKVIGLRRTNSELVTFNASRVYVAAGVLSSTKLVLDSLEAYDQTLTLKDSQYFMLPLLRYRGVPRVINEELHTLAQAFIEISDKSLSEKTVHLQIYGYNDLYRKSLENSFGHFYPLFRFASNTFLSRFLLVQGYLHSDVSATISLKLRAPENGAQSKLILEGGNNGDGQKIVRRVVTKLAENKNQLRAVPLKYLMTIGKPGQGNHSGGSLPMRARPGPLETDVAGRPSGFRRVHVVDSSVFPSIPATTITLTIMANAHRIAAAHNHY